MGTDARQRQAGGVTLGAQAWLRFDWNNDGNDDEPSAPATFGIYEGNPNMIHMREIWR